MSNGDLAESWAHFTFCANFRVMFLLEPELPGPQAIELHAKDMSESENLFCHAI